MTSHSYSNSEARRPESSTTTGNRSTRERRAYATNARPPPAVPYRRYPSLSDDGQPYFPRLRRARRNPEENPVVVKAANEDGNATFYWVRLVAFLVIIAIITVLATRAS